MTFVAFIKALLIIAGLVMLAFGGFFLLLTSTGDRGGDSGTHESGCMMVIGGFILLTIAAGIHGFEGA